MCDNSSNEKSILSLLPMFITGGVSQLSLIIICMARMDAERDSVNCAVATVGIKMLINNISLCIL